MSWPAIPSQAHADIFQYISKLNQARGRLRPLFAAPQCCTTSLSQIHDNILLRLDAKVRGVP